MHRRSGPGQDLLSFTFGSEQRHEAGKAVFIDAEDPSRALSALQARRLVERCIAGFKSAALQKGDVVLVMLANNFLYSAIYFSIIGAGGIYFGANPSNTVSELWHFFQLGDPKYVVTAPDLLHKIVEASEQLSFARQRIFIVDPKSFPLSAAEAYPSPVATQKSDTTECVDLKGCMDFLQLLDHGQADWDRFDDEGVAKSTPAAIFCTSGTGGLPKAAVSSHFAVVTQHLSVEPDPPYEIRRLVSLPFFHIFAAIFVHILPIRMGQTLFILPRFQLEKFVSAVRDFKITDTLLAPPIVHLFNKSSLPVKKMFETIRYIGVGGAPIDAKAMQLFRSQLHPEATLSQVWGMTEIGAAMLLQYPEQDDGGSIGRPLPGYEMRLVSSSLKTISEDRVPGELQVRYAGMMTGYKNHRPLREGDWFSTGDIMSRLAGKYYVVSRSKEMIKVNGFQVAPAEVEAVLLAHPRISDAAVVGVFREDGVTEVPKAYVVRKRNPGGRYKPVSEREVFEFARERLASYKAISGGIVFVDAIPRTASGKIQRFKLSGLDPSSQEPVKALARKGLIKEEKLGEVRRIKRQAVERRPGSRRSQRIAQAKGQGRWKSPHVRY